MFNMEIVVKNTMLLFLYRSFCFKFVQFKTYNNNLINIVDALNIKNKKKRIEYVYDDAIKYINDYYYEDLCKFENGRCIVQRKNNNDNVNGCCRMCPLVTDRGCPSSNLVCKLVYCKTALGNFKLLKLYQIPILKCLSIRQRIILQASFFCTRDEIIKKLNYGIIYSSFIFLKKELCLNSKIKRT